MYTIYIYFQRFAKASLPVSITWIALPCDLLRVNISGNLMKTGAGTNQVNDTDLTFLAGDADSIFALRYLVVRQGSIDG